jgi:hypothetical protein
VYELPVMIRDPSASVICPPLSLLPHRNDASLWEPKLAVGSLVVGSEAITCTFLGATRSHSASSSHGLQVRGWNPATPPGGGRRRSFSAAGSSESTTSPNPSRREESESHTPFSNESQKYHYMTRNSCMRIAPHPRIRNRA